jgi:hypothetical protein
MRVGFWLQALLWWPCLCLPLQLRLVASTSVNSRLSSKGYHLRAGQPAARPSGPCFGTQPWRGFVGEGFTFDSSYSLIIPRADLTVTSIDPDELDPRPPLIPTARLQDLSRV